MSTKKYEQTNRVFEAQADDGEIYTVIERQTIIESRELAGNVRHVKGRISFILDDGRELNRLTDGTFQIVVTDEIIREIS